MLITRLMVPPNEKEQRPVSYNIATSSHGKGGKEKEKN